jgi:hypothetical protein
MTGIFHQAAADGNSLTDACAGDIIVKTTQSNSSILVGIDQQQSSLKVGSSNVVANVNIVAPNVTATGSVSATTVSTSNVNVSGDIMPTQTQVQQIGKVDNRFKDAWIDTIHIAQTGLLQHAASNNASLTDSRAGDVIIKATQSDSRILVGVDQQQSSLKVGSSNVVANVDIVAPNLTATGSVSATTVSTSNLAAASIGASNVASTSLLTASNLNVSGDIMPTQTQVQQIGKSDTRFRDAWIDTVHIAQTGLLQQAASNSASLTDSRAGDVIIKATQPSSRILVGVDQQPSSLKVGSSNVVASVDVVAPNVTATGSVSATTVSASNITTTSLLTASNVQVSGNIMPTQTQIQQIGSSNNRFKDAWVDTIHIAQNTLYLGDTPVLGTNANMIQVTADKDQSINIKTTGAGQTLLTSENGVQVTTSGMNAQVVVQSTGAGGKIAFGANTEIDFTAPISKFAGDALVTGGLTSSNLTVNGSLVVNGPSVVATAQTVEIKDNILLINSGQVGTGVSAGQAGLRVDRGDAMDYLMVFEESDQMFKVGQMGQLETLASQPFVASRYVTRSNNLSDIGNATTARNNLGLGATCNVSFAQVTSTGVTVNGALNATTLKQNGTALAASATTDATNAANISSGSLPVARLPTSGVANAGTFGSATAVPVVTVDSYGRVTSASTAAINGSQFKSSGTSVSLMGSNLGIGTSNPLTALEVAGIVTRTVPILARRLLADRSVLNMTDTIVPFGVDWFDTQEWYGSLTGLTCVDGVFTNTTTSPKTYLVHVSVAMSFNATGFRNLWITRNNATQTERYGHVVTNATSTFPEATGMSTSAIVRLGFLETFSVNVYQNSGTTLTIGGAQSGMSAGYSTRIQITLL